ncbi:DUF4271 domain-containing protein [uncultured Weeksella sp.]|uniref:DUF4271 domain-containing protein n=1 Tax=uncultured Weeksella sp. TaxID=1161389 RepID=UPI00259B1786|nr:DUF4271 domain-containing protein [uncultured Weeksella sp.]
MQLVDLIPIARFAPTPDWVLYVLVGCMLMICAVKFLFASNFHALSNRNEYMNFADDNTFVFSMVINVLNVVLITLLIINFFDINFSQDIQHSFTKFLIVLGVVTGVMFVKVILELFYHNAFYEEQDFRFFFNSSSYVNARNVLVLMVLSFLFFYSSIPKVYIMLSATIFLVINRLWELFYRYVSQKNNFSKIWYHNILYLCTLEILPILVLIKLLFTGKVI